MMSTILSMALISSFRAPASQLLNGGNIKKKVPTRKLLVLNLGKAKLRSEINVVHQDKTIKLQIDRLLKKLKLLMTLQMRLIRTIIGSVPLERNKRYLLQVTPSLLMTFQVFQPFLTDLMHW